MSLVWLLGGAMVYGTIRASRKVSRERCVMAGAGAIKAFFHALILLHLLLLKNDPVVKMTRLCLCGNDSL